VGTARSAAPRHAPCSPRAGTSPAAAGRPSDSPPTCERRGRDSCAPTGTSPRSWATCWRAAPTSLWTASGTPPSTRACCCRCAPVSSRWSSSPARPFTSTRAATTPTATSRRGSTARSPRSRPRWRPRTSTTTRGRGTAPRRPGRLGHLPDHRGPPGTKLARGPARRRCSRGPRGTPLGHPAAVRARHLRRGPARVRAGRHLRRDRRSRDRLACRDLPGGRPPRAASVRRRRRLQQVLRLRLAGPAVGASCPFLTNEVSPRRRTSAC